jgi:colanic acid biosynthesis glycosyl transferase WcaI
MPRLLITTQVYPPEIHPTAVMVRELAEHLAGRGWEVTVCAGLPHHPAGRLYPGWRWRPWQRTAERGVEVVRTGHLVHESRAIPVRGLVFTSQALAAAAAALVSRRPDVVLVYGPPLVGPNLGALVAARHGAKLACIVYDLYPDIAIETGRVTNPAIIGAARIAERMAYRATDLTIVLSDGFKRQLVDRGVPAERIAVIPVWLDPDEIRPMDRDNAWRREQGIGPEKFVVLYAGTIGVVSGAAMVAEAAALLRERPEILFLFVGEGEEKAKVEARAKELRLSNMMFLSFQPRERLAEVQATADVGLVTLAPGRGRTSVPSKVLGYLAAGRPVIAAVDPGSDTAAEIDGAGCGLVASPADATALADAVTRAADDGPWRAAAGTAARARFEAGYSQKYVLERYEERLMSLV